MRAVLSPQKIIKFYNEHGRNMENKKVFDLHLGDEDFQQKISKKTVDEEFKISIKSFLHDSSKDGLRIQIQKLKNNLKDEDTEKLLKESFEEYIRGLVAGDNINHLECEEKIIENFKTLKTLLKCEGKLRFNLDKECYDHMKKTDNVKKYALFWSLLFRQGLIDYDMIFKLNNMIYEDDTDIETKFENILTSMYIIHSVLDSSKNYLEMYKFALFLKKTYESGQIKSYLERLYTNYYYARYNINIDAADKYNGKKHFVDKLYNYFLSDDFDFNAFSGKLESKLRDDAPFLKDNLLFTYICEESQKECINLLFFHYILALSEVMRYHPEHKQDILKIKSDIERYDSKELEKLKSNAIREYKESVLFVSESDNCDKIENDDAHEYIAKFEDFFRN